MIDSTGCWTSSVPAGRKGGGADRPWRKNSKILGAPFSEVTTQKKRKKMHFSAENEDKSAGGRGAFSAIQFSALSATDPEYATPGISYV